MEKLDLKAEVQKKLGDGIYYKPIKMDVTAIFVNAYLEVIENKINEMVEIMNRMRHLQSAELMRAYDNLMDESIK